MAGATAPARFVFGLALRVEPRVAAGVPARPGNRKLCNDFRCRAFLFFGPAGVRCVVSCSSVIRGRGGAPAPPVTMTSTRGLFTGAGAGLRPAPTPPRCHSEAARRRLRFQASSDVYSMQTIFWEAPCAPP
jgi:hypothetical protein